MPGGGLQDQGAAPSHLPPSKLKEERGLALCWTGSKIHLQNPDFNPKRQTCRGGGKCGPLKIGNFIKIQFHFPLQTMRFDTPPTPICQPMCSFSLHKTTDEIWKLNWGKRAVGIPAVSGCIRQLRMPQEGGTLTPNEPAPRNGEAESFHRRGWRRMG